MKAVFISYNQALTERVAFILDQLQIRGFTQRSWNRGWRTQNGNSYLAGDELRHHDHRGRRNGPSDLEICQESGRSE